MYICTHINVHMHSHKNTHEELPELLPLTPDHTATCLMPPHPAKGSDSKTATFKDQLNLRRRSRSQNKIAVAGLVLLAWLVPSVS